MLDIIIISSLKIPFELVKCFFESQQSALGQYNHQMKKNHILSAPSSFSDATSFSLLDMIGEKNLPLQISLWAGWTDVPLFVHFADFKMNRLHLWNFRDIKKRPRGPFKALPCVKLLVFLPLSSANFKALLYLCFFRPPTHWQSLKLFLNKKRKTQESFYAMYKHQVCHHTFLHSVGARVRQL